jgi:hypothetical protein
MSKLVITPSTWVEVSFDDAEPQVMLVVEKYNPDEDRWVKVYSPNEERVYSVHYEQITQIVGKLITPDNIVRMLDPFINTQIYWR